jgi:hypothetical protein
LLRGRATSQTWRYGPAPNTKRASAPRWKVVGQNSPVQTRVNGNARSVPTIATGEYNGRIFMVAYDLHDGEDYNDLIEAIQALPSGGSWHNLGSTWFVISKQAAVQSTIR